MPRKRLRGRLTRVALAAGLCLSLIAGAQARGLLGLFADETDTAPPPPAADIPDPVETTDPNRPVAWVSALRNVGDPAAVLYGYVTAGTRIDLGHQGEITLTWLSPCREETITGGVVTVTAAGPRVSGAPAPHSRVLSCQPLDLVLPGDRPAARQAVAVNTSEPLFLWPSRADASARVSLMDLATGEPTEVWYATVYGNAAPYPHEAPLLEEHKPYLIRAALEDGTVYQAAFSYDPDLQYSSAPINGLVMLRAAAGEARP